MMKKLLRQRLQIVTGLDQHRNAVLAESSIEMLLPTLCNRANRLIGDQETWGRLKPLLEEFICRIVGYFRDSDELDEYVMTNILTALATADAHGEGPNGIQDYSTLIRKLNPIHPDADGYFVLGRAGTIADPECPLGELEEDIEKLAATPTPQLHMFYAYHHARSMDTARDAPKIPVDDFWRLIPDEIKGDPTLEEAFMDVCFSDGAWELYQLRLAA